jgi:uncharacterized protein YjbI with pentapeptide repeats
MCWNSRFIQEKSMKKNNFKVGLSSIVLVASNLLTSSSGQAFALERSCVQEVESVLSVESSEYVMSIRDCDLSGFNFSGLNLHADFTFVNLTGANFSNSTLDLAILGSNLTGADFTSAELSLSLSNDAELGSANLSDTTLAFYSCADVDLTDLNLTVAREIKSLVQLFKWDNCILPPRYRAVKFGWRATGLLGPRVNLSGRTGVSLHDLTANIGAYQVIDLREANLSYQNIPEKWSYRLDGANLQGAIIGSSLAWGCNIKGTPIQIPKRSKIVGDCLFGTESDFSGYDLSGMNLDGVDLAGYKLYGANISGTELRGAKNFSGVFASNLQGIPKSLPVGYQLRFGFFLGLGLDNNGANFSGKDLTSINLFGCKMDGSKFDSTNLTQANLSSCFLAGSSMTNANVTKGNLWGSNLTNANLTGATLTGANIASATLGTANLTNVVSGGLRGIPKSLPKNWRLVGGYLVGPSANLVNAKLSKLNLSKIDLSKADLKGADLTGSNLSLCNLQGASLVGAKLGGTIMLNSKLDSRSHGIRVIGIPKSLPKGWKVVAGVLKKS